MVQGHDSEIRRERRTPNHALPFFLETSIHEKVPSRYRIRCRRENGSSSAQEDLDFTGKLRRKLKWKSKRAIDCDGK